MTVAITSYVVAAVVFIGEVIEDAWYLSPFGTISQNHTAHI